jgi:hydrogenase nickel incorporation protein HypB
MCGVCGCGNPEATSEHEHQHGHVHDHEHEHEHEHAHEHEQAHEHEHTHEHEHVAADGTVVRHSHGTHGHGPEHTHDDTSARARRVRVEQDILSKNDGQARLNRARFQKHDAFVVNLMSSPGSGKTTLLVRTLEALKGRGPLAVIEGDQQTTLDADRIRATGVEAFQVNTGKGCHLDATMIDRALERLTMPAHGVLFVENVGNLVCPAGFDLGESKKVVVISVTEGEDKPLKYPDMFAVADLILVNKVDLVPHLDFSMATLEAAVARIRPGVPVLKVSARSGEGFEGWLAWLSARGASAA